MTTQQCNGCIHLKIEFESVFTMVNGMKIPTTSIQTRHFCSFDKYNDDIDIRIIQSCVNSK